jgi:hypothetical protein
VRSACWTHTPISKVENSAQVLSCLLTFVHGLSNSNCVMKNLEEKYGELQCYLSQRCSTRIIARNKHLSKNTLNANMTIYTVSKYLCVDMAICNSQKYFVFI